MVTKLAPTRKMRMKFNNPIQLLAISAASLLAASFLSACATLTVDFVYVSSAKAAGPNNYGEINVFEINSESGRMRQITTSPFPSGGRNPVAEAVSPDEADLYVVNRDDNTIVQFIIGSDGKLYGQNTVNTPGIFPLGVTVSGKYLYVVNTFQPLPTCNPASPCSGSVAVFPILTAAEAGALKPSQPANTLGSPVVNTSISASYWPLLLAGTSASDVFVPTAITTAASGAYLYVTGYDSATNLGYVFGFTANADGTLTALSGSPLPVGIRPSARRKRLKWRLSLRHRFSAGPGLQFPDQWRRVGAFEQQPVSDRQPTDRYRAGRDIQICHDHKRARLQRWRLLHQFRKSEPAGHVHNGNAARCHRYRPFSEPVRIYRKFSRQQRFRISVEPHRWFAPEFAVFTLGVQCQSNGGRGGYAWQYQELALQPPAKRPVWFAEAAIRL